MGLELFTGQYAELYDLFHANKDYRHEVNEIIDVLSLGDIRGRTGFDFGCGTGVHASEFLNHGVWVDGFDISNDMLNVARNRNPAIKFSNNLDDFKAFYDFTYSLFDVLSYQVTIEAATGLIATLFAKTKSGGYCLVDSWNSQGVRLDPPKINERVVMSNFGEISRRVTPDLSRSDDDTYSLIIELLRSETQEIIRAETHELRAWSPEEVSEIMGSVGFKDLTVFNPINPKLKFEVTDWRFGIKANKP
jgi:SAM-dependent methyltransferase